MNETLHANIFFFITSVAVVAVTVTLLVVLWYFIAILREVRAITQKVRKASESLESDVEYFRQEVRSGGMKVVSMLNTIVGFAVGRLGGVKKRPTPRKRTSSETDGEESV